MMLYLIIPLIVLLDQATKILATNAFLKHGPQEITSFFRLTLIHNTGISLSLFNDLPSPWILTTLALLITGFLFYWQATEKNLLIRLTLLLIIGGALGNIIDRIRLGGVVDFLDIHWHEYHWPAFNVADAAVCSGMGLMFIILIMMRKKT